MFKIAVGLILGIAVSALAQQSQVTAPGHFLVGVSLDSLLSALKEAGYTCTK